MERSKGNDLFATTDRDERRQSKTARPLRGQLASSHLATRLVVQSQPIVFGRTPRPSCRLHETIPPVRHPGGVRGITVFFDLLLLLSLKTKPCVPFRSAP